MTVCKKYFNKLYKGQQRGTSLLEVVLAMSIIIAVTPFLYGQIMSMSNDIKDIALANKIVKTRDDVVNYVRLNQHLWDNEIERQLTSQEIEQISPMARIGFIDKYMINGAYTTDIYLAFNIDGSDYDIANIAKHIGQDAAIVREDGIAYSQTWAVSAPGDFNIGDLIYKVSKNFSSEDKSNFLHRGTMGEDDLNKMERDLHMNNFNIYNVSNVQAKSVKVLEGEVVFIEADNITADEVYFSSGANMNTDNVFIDSIRVTGDTNGFRKISANILNDDKYSTDGKIIADRADVANSINISNNLILKSDTSKTVSDFVEISASNVVVPYLSATNIEFNDGFGLTVSGELLSSGTVVLQLGSWVFPTNVPPTFYTLSLGRAEIPSVPDYKDFELIFSKDWQSQ